MRLSYLRLGLQAALAAEAKRKAAEEALRAKKAADKAEVAAEIKASVEAREAHQKAKQAGLDAVKEDQMRELAEQRRIELCRLKLYRSSCGYIDQHGRVIGEELLREIALAKLT